MKCDDARLSANLKQDWSGVGLVMLDAGQEEWCWSGIWWSVNLAVCQSGSGVWDWDSGEMDWRRQPGCLAVDGGW